MINHPSTSITPLTVQLSLKCSLKGAKRSLLYYFHALTQFFCDNSEPEHMAGSSASSSSSLSAAFSPKKYDVFISFRGEDTRCKFVSHLYAALENKSIKTYIDYQLHKGDEISQALLKAIESSSVSIVVFSENYAFSSWCLDELAKILDCRKDQRQRQVVIPVFYEVDPSHVRKQTESYKMAFAKHERVHRHNKDKVHKWKAALTEAANLAGWDSRMCRDESRLIQNIVNDVWQKLHYMYPYELEGLVGVDENYKCVELLLQKATIVGIWGMSGIGKTTIAKVVFAKLFSQYEGCCFLENVREESEKHGLKYLRHKLLFELLKEESEVVQSTFLLRSLGSKKVLIVLDDVNNIDQLDNLVGKCDYLHPGSKVIITSRDNHLLMRIVDNIHIHEIKELSFEDSLKLFCLNAFKESHPKSGYEELSRRAVEYTHRLPLALKILGASFHCKSRDMWKSALDKLKKYPKREIQNVLRLSYDDLDDLEKEIFQDIAFFWRGEGKQVVIRLLDASDFYAASGLGRLLDKALITISYNSTIQMHDLIQEMGWEIVRQESFKYPERRSRLRDIEEVYYVLKNNKGTDSIEGMMLDLSQSKDLELSADTFKKMPKLRIIKFFCSNRNSICNVQLPINLEFSDQLRYLEWFGYPLESLPSNFSPEKLVELLLVGSHVKKPWDGVQNLVNLKVIDFSKAKQLMELPDISKASNLEVMDLSDCERLYHLHPSIFSLPSLNFLDLTGCTKLQSLESDVQFKSLKHLYVSGCSSLKKFSLSSQKINELELLSTGIEIWHLSARHLISLKTLRLDCLKLKNLPSELSCLINIKMLSLSNGGELIDKPKLQILFDALRSLKVLRLTKCYNLSKLPDNISNLQSLVELDLTYSNVESLPSSIKHLSELRALILMHCRKLRSLPELPPTILELYASNCISLETIQLTSPAQRHKSSEFRIDKPKLQILLDAFQSLKTSRLRTCCNLSKLYDTVSNLQSLVELDLTYSNVESLPSSIKHLSQLRTLNLMHCRKLRSLPELPPSILELYAGNCLSLETIQLTSPAQRHKSSEFRIEYFYLENCLSLNENSLWAIMELAHFELKLAFYEPLSMRSDSLHPIICLPGNQIPEWFPYRKTGVSITFQLSISSHYPLLGFIFGIALLVAPSSWDLMHIKCEYSLDYEETSKYEDVKYFNVSPTEFNANNVYLWCSPIPEKLDRFIEMSACDKSITHNPRVSFEFLAEYDGVDRDCESDDIQVRGCGVCPIYALEYPKFIKEMRLELELEIEPIKAIGMVARSFGEMQISRKFIIPSTPMGTNWKNGTQGLKDIVFL